MLEDTLRKLGLGDKETRVYLSVAELGKASPARISKATGINRTTVYAVGSDLVKKGLLDADTTGSTTYYTPASPQTLAAAVEREKQLLKNKERVFDDIAREIEEMPKSKTYAVPKIKFVEHEENVERWLYAQSPIWIQSLLATQPTMWGFQDYTFVEREPYRSWIKRYWEQAPEDVRLNLLSNDSKVEQEMKKENITRRNIKFWKGAKEFTATQWIVGEYSILIQTRQKPHYLVQTHDSVYCQNMRELFKSLWQEVK